MASARRAMEDLMTWPGLSAAPARCGTGTAVLADGAEIVHFHSERQADLGRPAIERLHEELGHSTALRLLPGSGWVTVVLGGDRDADLLITLASVALRAQTHRAAGGGAGECNLGRISIIHTGHVA
ncbi:MULTISPECIES: luciferase domain-containing protein [Streptomyces]|uniref:luciferase domain-containing protein n=1 Tax=Streptomyces TaxID=1883 RepID=UPI0018DF5ABB|nr:MULTISPECIES: luciferase family protein [Streptomyces]MCZ4099697.1 DUF5519 family protein [Streptomyces sp. H39-C1]